MESELGRESLRQDLLAFQRELPKVDTHEHFPPEQQWMQQNADLIDVVLYPYNCDTIQSAGCPEDQWKLLTDPQAPFAQRASVLTRYLPAIRQTAFFQAVDEGLRQSCGLTGWSVEELADADRRLRQSRRPGGYGRNLDALHVERALCFTDYDAVEAYKDPRFPAVPTVSDLAPQTRADFARLERYCGGAVTGLPSLMEAVDSCFGRYVRYGVPALKFGSAYHRRLRFAPPDPETARRQLEANLRRETAAPYEEATAAVDDLITEHLLCRCAETGLPVVFHVGLHAWNFNAPDRCHASDLTELIARHPDVTFVLLHCGMPFYEEAVLLARYYPNVVLDLTWTYLISPGRTEQLVDLILDLVPANQVMAFGGDYFHIEALPGHLALGERVLAKVMAKRIAENRMSRQDAEAVLRQWYGTNPHRIYQLNTL